MEKLGEKTRKSSRRQFLREGMAMGFLGLTAVAGICICQEGCKQRRAHTPVIPAALVQVARGKVTIQVAKVEPLQKVGGSAKVIHPGLPQDILIARPTETRYVAVSDRCTHRGAEIEYDPGHRLFVCVNYGHSVFSLTGTVLRGPAPRSLPTYKTLLAGEVLEVFL